MKADFSSACFRVLAAIICFFVLCGFEDVRNGPVLELPNGARQDNPQSLPAPSNPPANPPIENEDSSAAPIPSGPDLRFHQLLKFFGCWQSIVTARDLTTFANTSSVGPKKWANQRARSASTAIYPASCSQACRRRRRTAKTSTMTGGYTELSGYDAQVVSLLNHQTFTYAEKGRNSAEAHWSVSGRPSRWKSNSSPRSAACGTALL
jgi:hypothetical protein